MLIRCLVWTSLYLTPVYMQFSKELKPTEDVIPCRKGWFLFGQKCYILRGKTRGERINWWKASESCTKSGGSLATISSKELQAFLVAFLHLDSLHDTWIGLHNPPEFKWVDGSVVNYTNWDPNAPTIPGEDCTELIFKDYQDKLGTTGNWRTNNCYKDIAYICQMDKSTENIRSPDPRFCYTDEGGGWKYQNSCYHIVQERKSWQEAEEYCQERFKGHLATILDFTVDMFLDHILSNVNKQMWIGIKIQEQVQDWWASGWPVAYSGFSKDPEFIDETCVLRRKQKEWITTRCSKKYSFICETSTVIPPVLKKPPKGSYCPGIPADWRDLGGRYCYFIDTIHKLTWNEANFKCIRRGGTLASIHSADETKILRKFIEFTQEWVFIGLHSLLDKETEFIWTDGSALDYTNWLSNEPNNDEEHCGEVWSIRHPMEWNDVMCDEKKGYICSVRKITPNSTESDGTCDCQNRVTYSALIGVSVCILLVIILLAVVVYYFRGEQKRKKSTVIQLQSAVRPKAQSRYQSSDIIITDDSLYEDMN